MDQLNPMALSTAEELVGDGVAAILPPLGLTIQQPTCRGGQGETTAVSKNKAEDMPVK